jgi:diguanylate cyclase (GGDEF)-like protein
VLSLRYARLSLRLERERQVALLAAVQRLGHAATRSIDDVCAELDRAIRALVPAVDSVLVFDDGSEQLDCVFASGARTAYFRSARIARDDERTLPALARAQGHRAELGDGGVRGFHPADAFALAVPLRGAGGAAAVVYVAAPVAVAAPEREAIVQLAGHAAFAYALASERERNRRRAEYDALTGLLAPRVLRERLGAAIARARLAPLERIALLFVDTDRFKDWNDAYGHASGDALLRALAALFRAAASGGDDLAARNGGDEFCLVLAGTEKSQAIERAEALRAAIEALDVAGLRPDGAGEDVRITASIGVAAFPVDATTPHALLERADEAMYHSKRSGRNAVSYFGPDGAAVRAAVLHA